MKKLVFALALAVAAAGGYYLDVLTAVPLICQATATIKLSASPSPARPSVQYSDKPLHACPFAFTRACDPIEI